LEGADREDTQFKIKMGKVFSRLRDCARRRLVRVFRKISDPCYLDRSDFTALLYRNFTYENRSIVTY
jgi:hypothetical protein